MNGYVRDTVALTRRKVEPMVRVLFARTEQHAVLTTLEKSVVFVTTANIEPLLLEHGFDHSAWDLANLYLASLGAKPPGEEAPRLVGLRETRTRKWLLDIEYRKRETFAYACEAYARILERAKDPIVRRDLADEYASAVRIAEERVDAAEVANMLQAAAAARNGWKIILTQCAPTSRPLSAVVQLNAARARAASDPSTAA